MDVGRPLLSNKHIGVERIKSKIQVRQQDLWDVRKQNSSSQVGIHLQEVVSSDAAKANFPELPWICRHSSERTRDTDDAEQYSDSKAAAHISWSPGSSWLGIYEI